MLGEWDEYNASGIEKGLFAGIGHRSFGSLKSHTVKQSAQSKDASLLCKPESQFESCSGKIELIESVHPQNTTSQTKEKPKKQQRTHQSEVFFPVIRILIVRGRSRCSHAILFTACTV